MNTKRVISIVILITHMVSYGGGFVEKLRGTAENNQKLFIGVREEKQRQLTELQEEYTELLAGEKDFTTKINVSIQEIKTLITAVEIELQKSPDDEFLNKKQTILKETYQIFKDTQRAREDVISLIHDFIKQQRKFLDDPEFTAFRKEYKLQERLYYSFENLQKLYERILDQERRIMQLSDQEKSALAERESRKRMAATTTEEYAKRQENLRALAESRVEDIGFGMNIQQEQELLQLKEQLYKYRKTLDDIRLKEIKHSISFIGLQLFVAKAHLDMFKEHLRIIKPAIRVSEADVTLAKEELAKERQKYFSRKDVFRQRREQIFSDQKAKKRELEQTSERLNVPLGRDIDEWSKEPKQIVDSYLALSEVGALNARVLSLGKEKDLLDAQIALEDEKFNYQSLRAKSKGTYYKIVGHRFFTEEDITKERKKYDAQKETAKASLQSFKEKISAVANLLNLQKKVLDNIKARREDAVEKKEAVFKGKTREYNRFLALINSADSHIKKQVDILGKLTGVYSGIISEINSTIRLIDFIIGELLASTIWYRPAYAITWGGVKNIIPDATAFFNDMRLYVTQFNILVFFDRLKKSFSQPMKVFIFLLNILSFLIGLLLLKRYQGSITSFLFAKSKKYGWLIRVSSFLVATVLSFIGGYCWGILLWISVLFICQMIPDPYIFIVFYLFSIPYLLYLSQRFMKFIMRLNVEHEYIFLPEDFQRRFELVLSTLLYVSIVIFFFRQAFMLSSYYLRSELPNILLAINFIMFQISLILLISKEQILNIIPDNTEIWRWMRAQVDRYYYLILLVVISIIVMSNPYVGFGRLVLYLLSGVVYTILLIKGMLWVHGLFKQGMSYIFFTHKEAVVRERFSHAKTLFGLVIIASFLIVCFMGVIIGAKIWGWPVSFKDIMGLFNEPLMLKGTKSPITTFSLLQIILFILSGFVVAYALNRFVLDKIFDLLLVESGVQHTVTRIIQYVVIIVAVFIGFQNVGLGSLIGYLFTALAFSIGWYIKEPISDFFSYFIILVQRPIKIGDYVQIDSETSGVVRMITPRSVIIRRKNSTTLVVPNSYVVGRSIENWNYVRNYIAFNDINILISFKENPLEVKEILFTVVDAHQNVLKNPKPIIRLNDFGESGFVFMVRGFISASYTLEMWDIASDIRLAMIKALRDKGIEIAVPVRRIIDIHHVPDPHVKKLEE